MGQKIIGAEGVQAVLDGFIAHVENVCVDGRVSRDA